MRQFLNILLILTLLSACSEKQPTLKVGTIAGPETELIMIAKQVANQRYHLPVEVISFTDYNLPNTALADHSIDMNIFQHAPYLAATNNTRGYHLIAVGKTFIYPMGIYSKRYQALQALPKNGRIAIPNDPTNEARALQVLAKAGLIQLSKADFFVSTQDIIANPKNLSFIPMNAAQLPRVVDEVDAAVINTNYAIPAGLYPSKDALFQETKDSDYANLIVIRSQDQNDPNIQTFVKAIQSPEVIAKARELFGNNAIVAWE